MAGRLSGEKILITGATGQVANPVAKALARRQRGVGGRALRQRRARARISNSAGVHCAVVDLAAGDYSAVPRDVTYALHFARASVGEWGADLDTNVGGLASLMEFCQGAEGVPALLVDGGVPAEREHAPLQGRRSARRQPPRVRVVHARHADVQHHEDRRGGRCALGRAPLRAPHDDRPTERAVRRRVQLARLPSRHDDARPAGARVRRGTVGVQPDPRRRHPRDDPRDARVSRPFPSPR